MECAAEAPTTAGEGPRGEEMRAESKTITRTSEPDGAWEDLPEDGDAAAYAEGFLRVVCEVYAEVEAA